MVHKEDGGPASKCKIEKNAIKCGQTGATPRGRHAKCSQPNPNATSEQNGRISYITPAFSGVPNRRGQNQKWPHNPYLLGVPQ